MTLNLVMGLFCGLLRPRLDIRAPLNTTTTYAANKHTNENEPFSDTSTRASSNAPPLNQLGRNLESSETLLYINNRHHAFLKVAEKQFMRLQ